MSSKIARSVRVPGDIEEVVRAALAEDVGAGDLTAAAIPDEARAHARVVAREAAIVCGAPWFDTVFRQLDGRVRVAWDIADGDAAAADAVVCRLQGPARALLTGERTALNFLQILSGTATLARRYAEAVAGTGATVLDTRKTVPGLRSAQKYAARCGGATNHRAGLYDAILIKENHIRVYGSITRAVRSAREGARGVSVEIEVEDLDGLDEALHASADLVLLDNFGLEALREAVRVNNGRARLEASGNVTLDNIRGIAETGVDFVSVGAITKDVEAVDLSMRFEG